MKIRNKSGIFDCRRPVIGLSYYLISLIKMIGWPISVLIYLPSYLLTLQPGSLLLK